MYITVFVGNWPAIKENLHQITYGHVLGVYKDITDGHIYRIDVPQYPDENKMRPLAKCKPHCRSIL